MNALIAVKNGTAPYICRDRHSFGYRAAQTYHAIANYRPINACCAAFWRYS